MSVLSMTIVAILGFFQLLLNPMFCLSFNTFIKQLNAYLNARSNTYKPTKVENFKNSTHYYHNSASPIDFLALTLINKMAPSNENIVT